MTQRIGIQEDRRANSKWSGSAHGSVFSLRLQALFIWLVVAGLSDVGAQSASTGALIGTVTDYSGAVLQNAQVVLRNTGTGERRTASTDRDGSYRFSLLTPGAYEVTLEAVGFAPFVV